MKIQGLHLWEAGTSHNSLTGALLITTKKHDFHLAVQKAETFLRKRYAKIPIEVQQCVHKGTLDA